MPRRHARHRHVAPGRQAGNSIAGVPPLRRAAETSSSTVRAAVRAGRCGPEVRRRSPPGCNASVSSRTVHRSHLAPPSDDSEKSKHPARIPPKPDKQPCGSTRENRSSAMRSCKTLEGRGGEDVGKMEVFGGQSPSLSCSASLFAAFAAFAALDTAPPRSLRRPPARRRVHPFQVGPGAQ